jgi:hypothetical protein
VDDTTVNQIDVCVVTRTGKLPSGLSFIPKNNLVIETSRPLGLARQKAIAKVRTGWFAFIDDDSDISSSWWSELEHYRVERVGAVQGDIQNVGLGGGFDQVLARHNKNVVSLKLGQRGFTHNTLIRTSLVKDWQPSSPKLEAYEDWELTQHILRKGYEWLVVPTSARHFISWRRIAQSAFWGSRSMKHSTANPTPRQKFRHLYNLAVTTGRSLRDQGVKHFVYNLWFWVFVTLGLMLS